MSSMNCLFDRILVYVGPETSPPRSELVVLLDLGGAIVSFDCFFMLEWLNDGGFLPIGGIPL